MAEEEKIGELSEDVTDNSGADNGKVGQKSKLSVVSNGSDNGRIGQNPQSELSNNRVGQNQIHDLLFSERLSWQSIIYDLINTEQLDPWDVDISLLVNKYLEKVRELEEANFFVSSKVLLASALLLRIKSDILFSREIPGLDDILFGKKEDKKYGQERIELEDEIPGLMPRTPLPRFRKVTLQELMSALGKAIKTENRRIKREIVFKQYEKEVEIVMPKDAFNLKEKIGDIYKKLKEVFSEREEKLAFSELVDMTKEEKLVAFVSLLHLDNQQKIWLEQENHFEEIWILLKHLYEKQNRALLELQRREVEKFEREEEGLESEVEISEEKRGDELVNTGFDHSEVEGEMEGEEN
jgi:segregation and condensation protein A